MSWRATEDHLDGLIAKFIQYIHPKGFSLFCLRNPDDEALSLGSCYLHPTAHASRQPLPEIRLHKEGPRFDQALEIRCRDCCLALFLTCVGFQKPLFSISGPICPFRPLGLCYSIQARGTEEGRIDLLAIYFYFFCGSDKVQLFFSFCMRIIEVRSIDMYIY